MQVKVSRAKTVTEANMPAKNTISSAYYVIEVAISMNIFGLNSFVPQGMDSSTLRK